MLLRRRDGAMPAGAGREPSTKESEHELRTAPTSGSNSPPRPGHLLSGRPAGGLRRRAADAALLCLRGRYCAAGAALLCWRGRYCAAAAAEPPTPPCCAWEGGTAPPAAAEPPKPPSS